MARPKSTPAAGGPENLVADTLAKAAESNRQMAAVCAGALNAQADMLDSLAAMYRGAAGTEPTAPTIGAAGPQTGAASPGPQISLELAKAAMIKLIGATGGKRDAVDAIIAKHCGSVKPVKEIPSDVLAKVHADVLAGLAMASNKPVGADDL